jgi:adenylyl-sulfate kinase
MVIWLTGLSGAGKTTISTELYRRLKPRMPELVLLDGDAIRAALGGDLGFTEADRNVQIRRVQGIAKLLSDQGLVVLVGVVYANPELLAWNRANFSQYREIYLRAPLDVVTARDAKGIYGRAARGETSNVVGVDIPWREPERPDLVLEADGRNTPAEMADRVIAAVPPFAAAGAVR